MNVNNRVGFGAAIIAVVAAALIPMVSGDYYVSFSTEIAIMINASWSLQRQSHGEQAYWSLVTLASLVGQIGLPGGGFGIGYGTLNSIGSPEANMSGPRFPQGRNAVEQFIPVARISDMLLNPGGSFSYDGASYSYPDIKIVYWAGGNPFHHHQDLKRLMRAWQKPETIIVHADRLRARARISLQRISQRLRPDTKHRQGGPAVAAGWGQNKISAKSYV